MLHGYTATTTGEEAVSGWTAFLAGTNAVVVYPQGNPTTDGGYGWTTHTSRYSTTGTDDVGVVVDLVNWLVTSDCVDPSQVIIVGESNGSALGLLVACSGRLTVHPRLFALAIPAVDGNVTAKCEGAKPFPLVVLASLKDRTVPYDGSAPSGMTPLDAPKAWFTAIMPTINGCTGAWDDSPVPDGSRLTKSACAHTTVFYRVDDGVHSWPGGPEGAGGLDPGEFPATALIWCTSGLTASPSPVSDCSTLLSKYRIASST